MTGSDWAEEEARELPCEFMSFTGRCLRAPCKCAAALRAAEARGMKWRPIATAPKDGTRIFVWEPARSWGPLVQVMWHEGWEEWRISNEEIVCTPTHWMPLFAPPSDSQQKE